MLTNTHELQNKLGKIKSNERSEQYLYCLKIKRQLLKLFYLEGVCIRKGVEKWIECDIYLTSQISKLSLLPFTQFCLSSYQNSVPSPSGVRFSKDTIPIPNDSQIFTRKYYNSITELLWFAIFVRDVKIDLQFWFLKKKNAKD